MARTGHTGYLHEARKKRDRGEAKCRETLGPIGKGRGPSGSALIPCIRRKKKGNQPKARPTKKGRISSKISHLGLKKREEIFCKIKRKEGSIPGLKE